MNHVLHLILSLITLGIWFIVWIIISIAGGEKRKMVTVDEYGNVATQQLGSGFHPAMIVGGIMLLILIFWLLNR